MLCIFSVPIARKIAPYGGKTTLLLLAGFYTAFILTPIMSLSWLVIPYSMLLVIFGVHVGILLWGIGGFWSSGNAESDATRNILIRIQKYGGYLVFAIMAPSLSSLTGAIVAYLLFLFGGLFS